MTKITIKAASLEITIDGTKQDASFITAALASLMASIIGAAHGEEFVEGTPDAPAESASAPGPAPGPAPAEPAPAEPAPADAPTTTGVDVSAENVLAFLRSDDQFEYRSYASVNKHFGGSHVDLVLRELVSNGGVTTKRWRADGETMYKAAPLPTEIPGVPEVAGIFAVHPIFNLENLRTFLTGDPRYTSRSYDAIAKHFGISDDVPNGLGFFLNDCVDDGDIKRTTRRRDGMPLYGVA